MADVHVYSPSNEDLTKGRILHSPISPIRQHFRRAKKAALPRGREVDVSGLDFGDDDSGADIPDIPIRRSLTPAIAVTDGMESAESHLAQILSGQQMRKDRTRPVNPNDLSVAGRKAVEEVERRVASRTERRDEGEMRVSSRAEKRDEVERRITSRLEKRAAEEAERRAVSPEPLLKRAPSPDLDFGDEPEPAQEVRAASTSTRPQSVLSKRSRASSIVSSYQTNDTSLAPLQTKAASEEDCLEPLLEEDIDPGSFDLVIPGNGDAGVYSLERRSEALFSKDHLQLIMEDPAQLQQFSLFLSNQRPASVPLLVYYLDALKALKAISYANAIDSALQQLPGHNFSSQPASATLNALLEQKTKAAFDALARDELPAYITSIWIQTVSVSIKRRIAGTLPAHLRDMSDGLAEVFCVTDPSRHDNPIVFASEEFHRTTQYGMGYVLGRNCRFLQGPKTDPGSVRRLKERIAEGKECFETFLNYRRDGSPFMNLLMCAPLYDSRGKVRYFLGAQVDVSGLAKDCVGLESLRRLVERDEEVAETEANGERLANDNGGEKSSRTKEDEFRELAEMFNRQELETVRTHGGNMHRRQQSLQTSSPYPQRDEVARSNWHKPRMIIDDSASVLVEKSFASTGPETNTTVTPGGANLSNGSGSGPSSSGGRLSGVYEHYLLVRPAPSLRILFASPSLRVPGILQSPLLSRVGGSSRVRDELANALADGQGVTAKVRWLARPSDGDGDEHEGRPRWFHCTPLIGSNGAIGVWMVVIVDEDDATASTPRRQAPPVDARIGAGSRMETHSPHHMNGHAASRRVASYAPQRKPPTGLYADDTASLFSVAHSNRSARDLLADRQRYASRANGGGSPGDTRPSSPYTLRIGED